MAVSGAVPSILEAARSGDKRALLVAMRDHLAWVLDDDVSPRDLAALTRRLLEVVKEIAALDARDEVESRSHLRLLDESEAFDITAL